MKAVFHYKNLLDAMTMNIPVPPFSVASFLHLNQIKGPICDSQGLVFPLHEDIKMHIHTHSHTQNTSTKGWTGPSLVAQWERILLPVQGTQVWSLVQEYPTGRKESRPMCHNYWACVLEPTSLNYGAPRALTMEPTSLNYRAQAPQLLQPTCLEPVLCNKGDEILERHN